MTAPKANVSIQQSGNSSGYPLNTNVSQLSGAQAFTTTARFVVPVTNGTVTFNVDSTASLVPNISILLPNPNAGATAPITMYVTSLTRTSITATSLGVTTSFIMPAGTAGWVGGGGSGSGASGVTSITESTTATGAITFTGAGVTQSGNTFTFSAGASGGSWQLTSSFSPPAVGSSGSFTVNTPSAISIGEVIQLPDTSGGTGTWTGKVSNISGSTITATTIGGGATYQPTLQSDTDIDQTTQAPGYVLAKVTSSGLPFSWVPNTDGTTTFGSFTPVAGNIAITVASTANFKPGQEIQITNGVNNEIPYIGLIASISGSVLTVTTQQLGNLTPMPSGAVVRFGGGGGGSSNGPAVVQEYISTYTNANVGRTITFDQTATAGNTLFLFVNWASEAGGSFVAPTGYTLLASQTGQTYCQALVYGKLATGAETGVSVGTSPTTQQGYNTFYFCEIAGDVSVLDQVASSNVTDNLYANPRTASITPSAATAVFSFAAIRWGTPTSANMGLTTNWRAVGIAGPNSSNPPLVAVGLYNNFGSGTIVKPPAFSLGGTAYSNAYSIMTASFKHS